MTEERKELTNEEQLQRRIGQLENDMGTMSIDSNGKVDFMGLDGALCPKSIEIEAGGKYVSLREVITGYRTLTQLIRISATAGLLESSK